MMPVAVAGALCSFPVRSLTRFDWIFSGPDRVALLLAPVRLFPRLDRLGRNAPEPCQKEQVFPAACHHATSASPAPAASSARASSSSTGSSSPHGPHAASCAASATASARTPPAA